MNKRIIIGTMGVKSAGKDTAAAFLCEQRGFLRLAFADKLYRESAEAFGVTVQFLGDRTKVQVGAQLVERKELPQSELALANCRDPAFVRCVLEEFEAACLPLSLQDPLSPRTVMQYWGTEYRRKRGVDTYWLDIVAGQLLAEPHRDVVITDVRFLNENQFILDHSGARLRVRNLEVEAQQAVERAAKGTASHSSETAILTMPADHEVFNVMGQLEKLRNDTLAYADSLRALAPA